jgi:hypothetical protein
MADVDQIRRNVRVCELLDESFAAFQAGRREAAQALMDQAHACDLRAVSVITGGMYIGEVPRPEEDPAAWQEYISAQREALARAEAEAEADADVR